MEANDVNDNPFCEFFEVSNEVKNEPEMKCTECGAMISDESDALLSHINVW